MPFIPTLSVLTSVYQGEEYLPRFLENLRVQTIFPELELILVLNEPSAKEKQVVQDFAHENSEGVQVLIAPERESLGASWNRAWLAARAPNIAMWNIDDRRVVDSLQCQLAALEQNPEAQLCYGDYLKVSEYGGDKGVLRTTPPYSVSHFRRAFAQGGAFWVLRSALKQQLGFFDEQFQVGADLEYSFRMAAVGLQMVRAQGLLGFFTDTSQGLSTREDAEESAVERTAIQLRYGVFDKVRREYAGGARHLHLEEIRNNEAWVPLFEIFPEYPSYLAKRKPLWILGSLRSALRAGLKKIGLLPLLQRAQEKYVKREI